MVLTETSKYSNNLNHKFYLLKEAVFNNRIVEFNYVNSYGENSKRKVLPNKLFFKSNNRDSSYK